MNNLKKYLKFIFFILCVGYLSYELNNSLENIKEIKINTPEIYFILITSVVFFNMISLRAFLLIKYTIGYLYSYSDWSKLHFESQILNSVISFSGTVYKAIQLKKRDVNYTQFIAITFLILFSYIAISLVFILIELVLLQKIFFEIYLILGLVLILIIFFSPVIFDNLIKFFVKFKIFNKYLGSAYSLLEILKEIYFKKTTIVILCLNTIIVHIFEIVIFYLVCNIFLENINAQTVIILFAASFIIDRIPFVSEIPGASEIILGTIGMPLGFFFIDGAIIKLTIRFLNYFSILLNSGVYFVVSYFDKYKFKKKDRLK